MTRNGLPILAGAAFVAACNALAGHDGVSLGDGGAQDASHGDGASSGSSSGVTGPDASGDAGMDAKESGPPPPSCAAGGPGMTTCGADGESCCTSLEVEGGTYYRTYDLNDSGTPVFAADGGPIGEADPATVGGLRLDKYLVTVGRFRQFVNAVLRPDGGPGYTPPPGSGKHTHLNGGLGLVNSGNVGGYETGWVATDDGNLGPTNTNLSCDPNYATWTASPGEEEALPINCVNWWGAY